MANLDEMIKKELEKETSEIDDLLAQEGGLPDMVAAAWKGSMRRWVWVTGVFVFLITGVLFWCGYEFFTAPTADDRLFWGFCTLFALAPQVALKEWQWMEMNRASMMREVKRLEIAVAHLAARLK